MPTESSGAIFPSPSLTTDPTYDISADSGWTSPSAQFQGWPEFSFPRNDDADFIHESTQTSEPKQQNDETKDPLNPCNCLSEALSVLSKLNQCLNFPDSSSFDNMLSVARTGFRVCEQISSCNYCPRSVMLMLCIVILQQVGRCYDALALNKATTLPSMSLKFGSMEFHGFSSPGIMSTILGIEKKQGTAVCDGLEKLIKPVKEKRNDEIWGGDHLSGLLGVFRKRFTTPLS